MKGNKYFNEVNNHEWLLTNGIGGYALGTGNLINQRKYHSLLTASDEAMNRFNLLSGLEIQVEWRGGIFHLDSTNYSSCIYPEGFLHLVKSWLRPYPIFLYSTLHHNNDILIKIELMLADRENTLLVKFHNLSAHKLNFIIKPKLALRNHHHINPYNTWNEETIDTVTTDKSFSVKRNSNGLYLYGIVPDGQVNKEETLFHNCYYPWEAIRGYYGVEDLISPVKMTFSLDSSKTNSLLFSDQPFSSDQKSIQSIINRISAKLNKLPKPFDYPKSNSSKSPLLSNIDFNDGHLFDYEGYLKLLEFSLRDFLVQKNVIAGYPWFGAWGRDTFIIMEALIKLPNTNNSCWEIFEQYASLIKGGLIPNMLSESGNQLNYNSIDSSLWFVIRLYELVNSTAENNSITKQTKLLKKAIGYCETVLSGIINNEDYPFHIADNGLLYLTEEFASATWMDAKVENRAVTPRDGAPVEINALFFNALSCYRSLCEAETLKDKDCNSVLLSIANELIGKIKHSFSLFWIGDYLADRLVGDQPVKEYRPNALIATSLPFPLLEENKMETVYQTAKKLLLTSYGLRTLTPSDYRFKRKYLGNQKERDAQYHQGTVWAWLLNPYVKTFYNTYKNRLSVQELEREITATIFSLRNGYLKGHIASVAEVWDGDRPHFPKGCPAQGWSVAALYLIENLLSKLKKKR